MSPAQVANNSSGPEPDNARGRINFKYIWRLPGGPLFLLVCLGLILGLAYAILTACGIELYSALGLTRLKCGFHLLTGLYCPGCGGTRALLQLLRFHPIKSLMYHPVPMYVALLAANFFIRFIFAYLVPAGCPLRLKPAKFRMAYVVIFFALYGLHCVVRNILLLAGIPTLG